MLSSRWKSLAALLLASAGLGGFAAAFAEEQAAETEQPIVVRARWVAAQEGEVVLLEDVVQVAEEASPYWIGVQLEPPTDILKAHLNLEGGMVTVHVFEGSPAEKAGLQVNDIILKAGDTYVKEPGDLLKCVGAVKENELTLVMIRGGKEKTLKIVPAKRLLQEIVAQPAEAAEFQIQEASRALQSVLRFSGREDVAGEPLGVDVIRVRPGRVAANTDAHLGLPKDVAVTITKKGENPTVIVVTKDGKEYEGTEEKLSEWPVEVRAYVQLVRGGDSSDLALHRLLVNPRAGAGGTRKGGATIFKITAPVPAPATATEASKEYTKEYFDHAEVVAARHAGDAVDSKLDRILKIVSQKEDSSVSALRKEVEQLRKELEELRKEKK